MSDREAGLGAGSTAVGLIINLAPASDLSVSRSASASHSSSSGSYYGGSNHSHTTIPILESPKLQAVAHYLSMMVGSYDPETLSKTCLGLAEAIKEVDEVCVQFLVERDVVGVVTKMMAALPSHSIAQQAGCEALLRCNKHVELRGAVEDHKAYSSVLTAMKNHSQDPYLIGKAVCTLASLAETAINPMGLKESKAYSLLLQVLRNHCFDVSVQSGGLLALAHVLKSDSYATSNIALQGEHKVILDAMRTHTANPLVVTNGCMALQTIGNSEMGVSILLQSDALELAVGALHQFGEKEEVAGAACGLVEALAAGVSTVMASFSLQIIQLKVVELLLEMLERYTEVLEIQVSVLSALAHIFDLVDDIDVSDSKLEEWLKRIDNAFTNHGREASLQEAACRCLARLLDVFPHLHSFIGNDEKNYQIPLHIHVWITLLDQTQRPDPKLFQAVSLAVYSLVVEDESLQQLLLGKGAAQAVLEGMREFLLEPTTDERCVEYGCRALIGLLMGSCGIDQKRYLMEISVVDELARILDEFSHDPEVVLEAFGVITCLVDVENFEEAVRDHSLHRQVLRLIDRHHNDPIFVENAIEVFIILTEKDMMIGRLNEADAMTTIVSVMEKHISAAIQRKGCLLLQLLCDEEYLTSHSLCTSIAKVVVSALARWRTEPEVQTEALACAQELCEASALMSEALVKGDIHLLLFNMLYREEMEGVEEEEEGGFIFQVGTDIMYTLCFVRDFKQEMLSTAVKDGLLEGVSVLIDIGADVNVGEEPNTPICLAVQSRNKQMVELLLHRGVNNVHRALTFARELKLDDIIGLLLQNIALDKNSGDIVNLSGLELRKLKPRWILPSLGLKNFHVDHRRTKSLDPMKKMLIHRKSIGCLEDALRAAENGTGMDELDSGVITKFKVASRESTPRKQSLDSVSTSHRVSSGSLGPSKRNSADSIFNSSTRDQNDTEVETQKTFSQEGTGGVNPVELEERLMDAAATPVKVPRRKHAIVTPLQAQGFTPSLPTIRGTPTHTRRKIFNLDSGVEDPENTTEILSPHLSVCSEVSDESQSLKLSPMRRHLQRKNTITGARRLPFINVDRYKRKKNAEDKTETASNTSKEEFSFSPKLMMKRLKVWKRKGKKQSVFSSDVCSRPDSPMPVVYSRSDYYDNEDSHELSPPLFSNPASPRSSVFEDVDEGRNGLRLSFKEKRASSSSSSMVTTPNSPSLLSSRRSSIDSSFLFRRSIGREETDCKTIPEEWSVVETSQNLVKVLDISSNQLSGLAELAEGGERVFRRLRALERLDLKQNVLRDLPKDLMEQLMRLAILNLSCNSFSRFPKEAVLSPCLMELDLSANKIITIPHLSTLPNLTRLNLSSNLLEEFPIAFNGDALPRLSVLNLKSNQIVHIPDSDSRLRELEELNISNNQIKVLPDRFLASLPSLRFLNASWNELHTIPGEVAEDMVQLQTLKVANNNLSRAEVDFNNFITSAPIIQTVDATENGLSSLPPPYAWKSRGVRNIRMTGNRITKLDLTDCGRYWPHLECLYLGQNKLKEIPREIGQLKTLSCVDFSHNREMRHLPNEMGNLEHLFMLNLQGLKNLSLDPSLLNGSTKAIISFLKSRHQKSVPYYHMKMMMVGGAGKGKTTLLHQLIHPEKPLTPHTLMKGISVATLGVKVHPWSYLSRPGITYHINCWDFAGQEEFYSTHQCFLTCRSLYVVVYNLSRGESELQLLLPWLLNIQARAPSSPVIIVGTHLDRIPPGEYVERRRQMRTKISEMLRKPGFPSDVSFAEVTCFDDKMVGTLRRKMKELIDNAKLRGQKIMGGMVPANYLALEELIQREKKQLVKAKSRFPVLRASRLKELMNESKLTQKMDKSELDQAIRFLHECGVLLHYRDLQSKLSELCFLDPEWLCSLMAQIITVTEVNSFISAEGLLQVKSLHHLLKEPRFPSEFIPEYIRLLERFEVALRQTTTTLLIPSCLPRKKPFPTILPSASPGSQIIRRYTVCYIPPGFWPRLIARLIAFPGKTLPRSYSTKLPALHVWAGGVYSFWSEQAFFLVELLSDKKNTFDIIVPTTNLGTKLLCSVVDNVEALIDEWFPGLRDFDVLNGDDLVLPLSLCPLCPISMEPHCFMLKQLQQVALTADEVECPQHHGMVILEQLAPDIVVSDLDPKYKVMPEEFQLVESSSNVLGKGGFGEVYKAMFRGRAVAVKVFSQKVAEINNTTPNHLIRQEVSILSQLEHPHIISMVAVCLRPKPMLLLEYAELGSLSTFYPYSNISVPLKHRIALQVASALAFLHKNCIIYRDLKADNVLIFSLSLIVKVNAKLSDYGIACYATECGLTQSAGTVGYKAPELLKADSTYNDRVDIYSYGLLLFVMMTNGHKPFEELSTGYQIDKAIEDGQPINDIQHYGCPPWPDMQDLITHCLQYVPSQRPSAQEVFDRLCSAVFVSLKRAIPVQHDRSIETFTIRSFTEKRNTKSVEVWMASTLGTQTMLSTMNLSNKNACLQGMMLPANVQVYCMAAVDSSLVLMGTNTGLIFVYDGYERRLKHKLSPLSDSVLCLVHFKSQAEGVYCVCAGLANGQLALYDQYVLTSSGAHPRQILSLGVGPIRSVKRFHSRLYVGCGQEVVVVRISDLTEDRRWRVVEDPHNYVTHVDVGLDFLWTAHRRSPKIFLWDLEEGKLRGTLTCDGMMNSLRLPEETALDHRDSRVTAMMLQPPPHSILWVGLGSGHLLLINAATRTPILAVQRHVNSIRCIQAVKALVTDKPVHLVLTGGFGFHQRPGYKAPEKGTPESYGNLLVWDSIMPRIKTVYNEIRKDQEPFR